MLRPQLFVIHVCFALDASTLLIAMATEEMQCDSIPSAHQADIVLYKPEAGVPTARRFVTNPFEGDGVEQNYKAGIIAGARHTLHNGREDPDVNGINSESIETRGFVLAQQPLAIEDWNDKEEVQRNWYPMIEDLAKRLTKADRVFVASYVLRSVGATRVDGVRGGAYMAHGDFNDKLKSQLLGMYAVNKKSHISDPEPEGMGISQDQLKDGRLMVLNFWRNRGVEPVRRAPLAVCDATSMQPEDMHCYAHDPNPPPKDYSLPLPNELTVPSSSEGQRWFYFPNMTKDEVLVLKTYDSKGLQPSNGVGAHSSFDFPDTDLSLVRESVEARVICFAF